MIYASDRLRHDGDITYGEHRKDGDSTLRLTVPEAAGVMGISAEAVRQRIKRRTLPTEKDAGGTVFVLLDESMVADRTRQDANGTRQDADRMRKDGDSTPDSTGLVESLQDQVEYLREQLRNAEERDRENRRIIAGLVQRVPELEPSGASEARPTSRPASEVPEQPREKGFWSRFLGL